MRNLDSLPEGFQITGIDIRGGVMYIEGSVRLDGEVKVQVIPVKVEEDHDEQRERVA